MKSNVFLKSVLRQPIRAFILALLIGASAFALVARVTEYFVVRAEIERVEGFYRSVGILSPLRFDNFSISHDVSRALDIMESNPHVAISDARRFTQGVFSDMRNLTAVQVATTAGYFNPTFNEIDVRVLDHYFIGRMTIRPRLTGCYVYPALMVQIASEELLAGDPSILREGDTVFTNELGQTTTVSSRYIMYLRITPEEAQLFRQGLWCPFEGLETGERALFRATPIYIVLTGFEALVTFVWNLRSLTGDDGLTTVLEGYNPRAWGGYNPRFAVNRTSLEGLTFFVQESDTVGMRAAMVYMHPELELLRQNQSSVTVVETRDMTAMPRFMDGRVTMLLDTPMHRGGRFLTYEDYGMPVAVVPAQFLARRGVRLGDTITVTLRDNPRPTWIDQPTHSVWARGVENWWDNNPMGWWSMIDAAHENWRDFPTYTLELEVVGAYFFTPPFFHNFTSAEIFIPGGLMPEGFGWDDSPQLTGMYSFVLDSPRSEEAFVRQTRAALAEMGFAAVFIPSGFETLAAVTDPIRFSITVNLIVFGVASFLILTFVIFFYIRQWRKSVAIAQALGIPRNWVLHQLFDPVFLFWLPAVVIGSIPAWYFALAQAEGALAPILTYGIETLPAVYWLVVFCAVIILFILAGVLVAGYHTVRRPVLEQLQGGTQKRQKIAYVEPGEVPEGFAVGTFALEPLPRSSRAAIRAFWRHRIRHVVRTPVRTGLVLALSLLLVFSLGWLNNTILFTESEIERLWNTTVIEAELYRSFEEDINLTWPSVVSPEIWDRIAHSGFLGEAYLESVASDEGWIYLGASHLPGLIVQNTKTVTDEQLGVICDDMTIDFLPGFGEADFAVKPDMPIPVVIRRALAEEGNIPLDAPFIILYEVVAQVIGVFDGGLLRAVNQFGEHAPLLILPVDFLRTHFYRQWPFYGWGSFETVRPPYMTARFTIDPAMNREIDSFREMIELFLGENDLGVFGRVPLILLMDDDVLHEVILPLEQNLSLLRVLYPIAIGLAFLLAAGLSLLSLLQNAKNAAILRVLGNPKARTQFALCIEQMIICVAGSLFGLLILFAAGVALGLTPFALAGIYFLGALIGSGVGAFVVSTRPPLELLQVRE
ncbi:MAG: hypothetical protein FWB88_07205 [Defluviitaleaceae bacterium]|nr:hypothetical protein [Defluviitaleaceae bacterium]MCL2239357.1 hypothetical protein [Defluviitaleaceae bacterium]